MQLVKETLDVSTTAKGTGFTILAGKQDSIKLDFSVAL